MASKSQYRASVQLLADRHCDAAGGLMFHRRFLPF